MSAVCGSPKSAKGSDFASAQDCTCNFTATDAGFNSVPSTPDRIHRPGRGNEFRGVDLVADPLLGNILFQSRGDLVVGRAGTQQAFHIRLFDGKQAVPDLA